MNPPQEKPSWDYNPSGATAVANQPATAPAAGAAQPPPNQPMTWTASEFVEHQRGAGWYLLLIVGTAVVAGLAYITLRDYFASGIVVVMGLVVAFLAGRKPDQVQYQLTDQGINVGLKFYKYSSFRSFSIIREGNLSSVELLPLKKIALPVAAYFGPGDEERIMDVIGQHLPYEERKIDNVDRLSRRLRF